MESKKNAHENSALAPGLGVVGCFATGIVGIIQTFFVVDPIGVGICLIASSFAFGIVVWVSYK
jgi:hypothetical protein